MACHDTALLGGRRPKDTKGKRQRQIAVSLAATNKYSSWPEHAFTTVFPVHIDAQHTVNTTHNLLMEIATATSELSENPLAANMEGNSWSHIVRAIFSRLTNALSGRIYPRRGPSKSNRSLPSGHTLIVDNVHPLPPELLYAVILQRVAESLVACWLSRPSQHKRNLRDVIALLGVSYEVRDVTLLILSYILDIPKDNCMT